MSKTKNEMAPAAPPVQGRRRSLSDPLSAALQPPENETPEERAVRVKREAEARLVSQGIDESIRRDAAERKKNRAEVNVLLLGQSESGKSTTLKRMSLHSDSRRLLFFFWEFFLNRVVTTTGGGDLRVQIGRYSSIVR